MSCCINLDYSTFISSDEGFKTIGFEPITDNIYGNNIFSEETENDEFITYIEEEIDIF